MAQIWPVGTKVAQNITNRVGIQLARGGATLPFNNSLGNMRAKHKICLEIVNLFYSYFGKFSLAFKFGLHFELFFLVYKFMVFCKKKLPNFLINFFQNIFLLF